MYKYLLMMFCFAICNTLSAQDLSNDQLNRLISPIKNDYNRLLFNEYYVSNLPCSECDGGWIEFPNNNKNEVNWHYKNGTFKGVISTGTYELSNETLVVRCIWKNKFKNGAQTARVIFRYYLNERGRGEANLIIKLTVGSSAEMISYVNLDYEKMNYMNDFVKNLNKKETTLQIEKTDFDPLKHKKSLQNVPINRDQEFYFNNAWNFVNIEGEKSYDAIANFETAIKLNPFNGGYYSDLGNCYRSFKQYKKAEECYSKAIENDFKKGFVYYNRAICYYEIDNIKSMKSDLAISRQLGWTNDYYKLSEK